MVSTTTDDSLAVTDSPSTIEPIIPWYLYLSSGRSHDLKSSCQPTLRGCDRTNLLRPLDHSIGSARGFGGSDDALATRLLWQELLVRVSTDVSQNKVQIMYLTAVRLPERDKRVTGLAGTCTVTHGAQSATQHHGFVTRGQI